MDPTSAAAAGLTILGHTVRNPVAHVECFAAPAGCSVVRLTTDELVSVCPVTGQPDLSSLVIEYEPDRWCVESKSLKLYLWSFRDRPVFAEALAAEVATEIRDSARPHKVRVTVTQRARGGIAIQAEAQLDS
jgi:7-cyano-7-deazaguanine reductase